MVDEEVQSSSGRLPILRPSRQARISIHEAFERLQKSVSTDDERSFSSTTLEDVYTTARDVERQLAARGELRNMRRLQPFFDWLLQYSKEMEILCNGTPYLPWIWVCSYALAYNAILTNAPEGAC